MCNDGVSVIGALRALLLALFALPLAGCETIGNIFEAGVWTGVVAVVAVIALIIFAVSRLFKK